MGNDTVPQIRGFTTRLSRRRTVARERWEQKVSLIQHQEPERNLDWLGSHLKDSILLKNPLGRKIPNFWRIKSPYLYRKNPSTGILERRFLLAEYDFLQSRKSGVFSAESKIREIYQSIDCDGATSAEETENPRGAARPSSQDFHLSFDANEINLL